MNSQTTEGEEIADLRHQMRNLEAQIEMLSRLLVEGADRLEQVIAENCEPETISAATKTARRLRRATAVTASSDD